MDVEDLWGDEPDWLHDDSNESGEGNDEDDELSGDMTFPGSQHVLVLLDCRREMLQEFLPDPEYPEEKCSPMDVALAACEKLVRQKVRTMTTLKTGKRDGFGVVLYNTRSRSPVKNDNDDDGNDGIHTKKPPKSPTSDNGDDGDDEKDDGDDDDDESVGYARRTAPTTVHELLPLAPAGKQAVLTVKAAHIKDPFSEERELDIEKEYGHPAAAAQDGQHQDKEEHHHAGTHPLDDAFYQVMQIFSNAKCVKKPKIGEPSDTKSVWIFTNNDDPTAGRSEVLEVLKTKASDFRDLNIDITVWPLPPPPPPPATGSATDTDTTKGQPTFAYEKFYDEIGASTPARGMTVESMQDLLDELTAHFKLTRRTFAAPLLMPDWRQTTDPERPAVMLDFYRLVKQSKFPGKVQIHQETGRELSRVAQRVTAEGKILETNVSGPGKAEISGEVGRNAEGTDRLRTFIEFGGERIPMSEKDKKGIRMAGNANNAFASLILLGFKDTNAVPFMHTLEETYFAYPNDERVEGSSSAFAHLHAAMLRKNVVAIGELLTRVSGTMHARLVAMRPLEEELCEDEINGQVVSRLKSPPGMVVVALPFEDDVRAMEPDAAVRSLETGGTAIATEKIVNAAMDLVQKQTLSNVEIGENFENATLAKFWDYVEHVALGECSPAEEEYDTVVDKEGVLKVAGEQITALKESLPPDVVVKPETAGSKRKIEADDSGVDWELMFVEGRLSDCKNDQLKKKLRSVQGAKLTGNKGELVERVTEILEREFSGKQAVKEE